MADGFETPKLQSTATRRGKSGQVLRPKVNLPIVTEASQQDTLGSSYQGMVHTTYASLVECFGNPTFYDENVDGKTKAEWRLKIGDTVVIIFDYRSRKNPKRNHEWYISGHNPDSLLRVASFFPNDVRSIYSKK